jgi:hypothetical protein
MSKISKNGTDWSAWTTFTSGAYKQYLPAAQAAVSKVGTDPVHITCDTPGIGGLWCFTAQALRDAQQSASDFGSNTQSLFDLGHAVSQGSTATNQQLSTFLKGGGLVVILAFVLLIVLIRR